MVSNQVIAYAQKHYLFTVPVKYRIIQRTKG